MKKIALIICLFVFALGAFAQSSPNAQESVSALKAKIVKLEAQIKEDVEIIRAIRAENRALKKELRKMRKTSTAQQVRAKKEVVQNKQTATPKVEPIEKEESLPDAQKSSIWDNMFPF